MTDQTIFDEITRLDEARQQATLSKDIDSVAGIIGADQAPATRPPTAAAIA